MTTWGYVRTSRDSRVGSKGRAHDAQRRQLIDEGVPPENIFIDSGVRGTIAMYRRKAWAELDGRLVQGDTVVVTELARLGRRWLDTRGCIMDLARLGVRIQSLAEGEAFFSYMNHPDPALALVGDVLVSCITWSAEQEHAAITRRTNSGVARARSEGRYPGRPRVMDGTRRDRAELLRGRGRSDSQIAKELGVSKSTILRSLGSKIRGSVASLRSKGVSDEEIAKTQSLDMATFRSRYGEGAGDESPP